MPVHTIAFMLLRFYALYWFLDGLIKLISAVWQMSRYGSSPVYFLNLAALGVTPLLYLIFSIAIWFAAPRISRLLMRNHDSKVSLAGVTREDLYAAGFVIVGACYFLSSFAPLINWIHYFVIEGAKEGMRKSAESGDVYEFYFHITTILASLTLILVGPRWARKLAAQNKGRNGVGDDS